MKAFNQRLYYKLQITLDSPVSVGTGSSEMTDHDVLVDSKGAPVISATSITGAMRSYVYRTYGEETADEMFGSIKVDGIDSKLRVFDAAKSKDSADVFIATRDCVKLKDKIGVKGAKFDLQVVETGAVFVSFIELMDCSFQTVLENVFSAINCGIIRFGSKTNRGYGKVKLSVLRACCNTVTEWIGFKMFNDSSWAEAEPVALSSDSIHERILYISLKSRAGISIREYSTDIGMPDYKTLSLKNRDSVYTPVIPGTTWAGAFRDRCSELLDEDAIKRLFGFVDEDTSETKQSMIRFSESIIENGKVKDISRNSIDRFSAATKRGALYTERTYFGGETLLEITIPKDTRQEEAFAIGVCLSDLHNGFLSVGGLTSIGRGLFEMQSVKLGTKELKDMIVSETPDLNQFVEEVLSYDC